jgi:hypothetical protein
VRLETVEHPFGTLKMRMGATHFLDAAVGHPDRHGGQAVDEPGSAEWLAHLVLAHLARARPASSPRLIKR